MTAQNQTVEFLEAKKFINQFEINKQYSVCTGPNGNQQPTTVTAHVKKAKRKLTEIDAFLEKGATEDIEITINQVIDHAERIKQSTSAPDE